MFEFCTKSVRFFVENVGLYRDVRADGRGGIRDICEVFPLKMADFPLNVTNFQ